MSKTIKYLTIAALSFGALALTPQDAKAGDYCREYTRTVYIGGRAQDAYGTACQQSDGSWMIVGEGLGNDIPSTASDVRYVIHDERREVIPTSVVYYNAPPVRYYRPQPVFVWNQYGYYRNGHHVPYYRSSYRGNNGWHNGWGNNRQDWKRDRHDRHDRDDDRSRVSIRYDWRD